MNWIEKGTIIIIISTPNVLLLFISHYIYELCFTLVTLVKPNIEIN